MHLPLKLCPDKYMVTIKPKSRKRPSAARSKSAPRRIGVARTLSKLGIASRTVAAQWVTAGRVAVNGRIVRDPETPVVAERDRITVDGRTPRAAEKRHVMLNKPRGLVTTARDEQGRATVYSCFTAEQDRGLAPVGRLDKASEGLLLFSNDSEWASRLLDPAAHLSKLYHVQVDALVDADQLARMRNGISLEDGSVMGVSTARLLRRGEKNCWLEIALQEGKNRQIRRIAEALGLKVLRLVRVAVGPLILEGLAKGESRELSETELREIEEALIGGERQAQHS
jgi:23S rRNA pseudouridine2605 synthase